MTWKWSLTSRKGLLKRHRAAGGRERTIPRSRVVREKLMEGFA
jgi:hypothetical protein